MAAYPEDVRTMFVNLDHKWLSYKKFVAAVHQHGVPARDAMRIPAAVRRGEYPGLGIARKRNQTLYGELNYVPWMPRGFRLQVPPSAVDDPLIAIIKIARRWTCRCGCVRQPGQRCPSCWTPSGKPTWESGELAVDEGNLQAALESIERQFWNCAGP